MANTKLQQGRIQFDAKKQYLAEHSTEYQKAQEQVRSLELELQEVMRLQNAVRTAELKVVQKQAKASKKSAAAKRKQEIEAAYDARKMLRDVKRAEKAKLKALQQINGTGKWKKLETKLDTGVDPDKMVNGKLIPGARRHKYSGADNIISATQISGLLYKGPKSSSTAAADYGTLYHRAIEELEKGLQAESKSGKKGK